MQDQQQTPGGWNVIYAYTRQQAIEDGVLMDLMQVRREVV